MLLYDRLGAKVAQGYLSGTCGVCWIERVPGSQGGTRKHCVCVCVCVCGVGGITNYTISYATNIQQRYTI